MAINRIIRPSDLETTRDNPNPSEWMVVDNETSVAKSTVKDVVEAGRPAASRAEAEAGANAEKAMTPLTVDQKIEYEIGRSLASKAQGDKADSAIQEIVEGANTTVDNTDPQRPIISSSGNPSAGFKADIVVVDGQTDWRVARNYKTVSDLLADDGSGDMGMGYSGSGANVIVSPGDIVTAQGFRYEAAGSGAIDAHVETAGGVKLYYRANNRFNIAAFGAVGDGATDETLICQRAGDAAAAAGRRLLLNGGTYIVSNLVFATDLEIGGIGIIRKKAGTSGHLLRANNANLTMVAQGRGKLVVDPNATNNPNPSPSATSDVGILHSGARLILRGITILGSLSSCVRSTATELVSITDGCDISGGWVNAYFNVPSSCEVIIDKNKIHSSHRDDCLQVLGGGSVLIDGNHCYNSGRSGIVISAAAISCRIVNNHCNDNKKEVSTGQGGWGIVASVDCSHFIIANNNCKNNETGGISADTYNTSTPSYTSAHHVIANNIVDGEGSLNPDGYCTTGISVNGSRYASVTGNYVRRANQGILMSDPAGTTVSGNTVREIGDGATFFIQVLRGLDVMIGANTFDGAGPSANTGAISIVSSDKVSCIGNKIENVTGSRSLFRITSTTNYVIADNDHHKSDAGTGFVFQISGVSTGGVIKGNAFICSAASYQYYIVATGATVTGSITRDNDIICTGVQTNPNRYILNGADFKADNDNINGVKNSFSAEPTMFTPMTGAVAMIAGAVKGYNGSAWV